MIDLLCKSVGKLGAWFLLMIISYVLVALVHRPQAMPGTEADGKLIMARVGLQPASPC